MSLLILEGMLILTMFLCLLVIGTLLVMFVDTVLKNFFVKLWQTVTFLWRGFSYKASCKLLGHPWEWVYFCKPDEGRGYDAWCRWCADMIPKYPRMRAFKKHKGDHTYGCEIKEK